ncbi:GNAT family N-acetyltransferase [Adlercreutzia sp. ZJ138]|uniref:GNAT family N-acetyltransferase n=1 Tax=Adlercreutzia sp. ZJ138 TaxID=2709405 RepID=UPI0013EB9F66|nr:GNAT family N-acetyltransferase [Adlercreutzia sp. ZJ138]
MRFRKAEQGELDSVLAVIADGRAAIAKLGIDQWSGGNPKRELIELDLRLRRSHVAIDEESGRIMATAVIDFSGEPDYDAIEGAWLTSSSSSAPQYAVVHRFAVVHAFSRQGVAKAMLNYAEGLAREQGCVSVRVDTHPGNVRMLGLLERCGYHRCGIVYMSHIEGATPERVAFEKMV